MPGQTSEIVSEDFSNTPCPKNISSFRSSSAKSAESQRIAAFRIHSYLQDPNTSVPYAMMVNNPQASVHKQLSRVAAAGYRMGTMLEKFDKAFEGNTGGGNNDSNDPSSTGSQIHCLDDKLAQGWHAEKGS
ncbi:uncharacterized protein EAE98_011925 [Botrytis deweyae]|uniref:Uncharacterized protein n=1 Tax=Botrytis deweyae TaxID=2478750 RepID=A0ABQ7I4H2_9HELO|nr:uncharacterized protein EAE98_011925 [Botrytis deweyae]KAF7911661.1 hypothetical protein EAE98_011925 [Botrytis deweyae]